ncbi:BLUF domain-containing protein [Hydrogenophaga sp.]|uniref:BLUF domain-containing protein n=1 Tax=Hydrogenophaga sp. TaxID=1904254 RepID=UPI00286E748B|nr:BLUF domain-containing protein [Hydrogenophaga sp.]
MSSADQDSSATHWPDSASEVPLQVVSRLIYASLSKVDEHVLDEMRRIRDHAVVHNQAAGLRVALLHMSGWFVEWIEGPEAGIRALLDRVAQDPRHQGLQVVHHSRGKPRLFRPWIGSIVQSDEGPTAFARRLFALQDRQVRQSALEPASVWLRLCSPPAVDMPLTDGAFPRAMLLSAQGAQAFELLQTLAAQLKRPLVCRRFAGAADAARDVESDYLDLPALGQTGWRLVANARKGLAMGMAHAFLPDHAAVVLLLSDDAARNQHLVDRVLAANQQVHHVPVIVGLGTHDQVTPALQEQVERQGLPWVAARSPLRRPDAMDLWAVLQPVLAQIA